MLPPKEPGHIYFRYVIGLRADSEPLLQILHDKGVGVARPVYLPLHRHLKLSGYATTETAWSRSVSIPLYPSLTQSDINRVIDAFASTYRDVSDEC
jgi:dTDP-4-amino-4,6-dideoxygalactose transaminase